MNRDDRRLWRTARTLADIGELTARWIEGWIGEQPGYCGPSDLDNPERLVPLFARLCRTGYVTTQSQDAHDGPGYDGVHWQQRCAVEGFATPEMTARLRSLVRTGFAVIPGDPSALPRRRINFDRVLACTRRDGIDCTSFGAHLSRAHLASHVTGYGACGRDAVAAVCEAWQVTVIDPVWGRPHRLWDALEHAVTREVA